jgi:hypothetical protein
MSTIHGKIKKTEQDRFEQYSSSSIVTNLLDKRHKISKEKSLGRELGFSTFRFSCSVKSDIKSTSFLLVFANALDSFVLVLTLDLTEVFDLLCVVIDTLASWLSVGLILFRVNLK